MLPGRVRRALRESSTITWRTVLVAGGIGLAALVGWISLLHTEARRHAAQEAERSADVVAQAVAREQARLIEASQQLLFGLSQRPEVVGARGGECAALFDSIIRAYGGYLDLVLARPDGAVVCSARGASALPGAARVDDVVLAARSGSTRLGAYGLDRASRRPTIAVSTPVVDDGGVVRGVVVAALDLSQLTRAVVETRLPAGTSLLIVDRGGIVLGHYPDPERWTGEFFDEFVRIGLNDGWSAGVGLDGVASFFVAHPLLRDADRTADALVVIAMPRRAVFRDADRFVSLELAGVGVLVLGGTIVGGVLVDRLVRRPAHGVLRVVRSLSDGDLRARMRRGDRQGTVGQLARGLKTLAQRMEARESEARRLSDDLKRERAARLMAAAPAPPAPSVMPTLAPVERPVSAVIAPSAAPTMPADALIATDGTYWGFREPPFQNVPNPRFLWLSPSHSDALVRLAYALQQRRGCALLTGEPGCGKTLLTHAVIQRLDAKRYEVALLSNPRGGRVELLREVLYELGLETAESSPTELVHVVHDVVVDNHRNGRETLIIVDDAQQVDDPGWFEELGGLLNLHTVEQALVTILLVGSPELTTRVRGIRHLDRRVSIRCEVKPLDVEQTGQYIAYRLSVASGSERLFTAGAVAAIHQATGGVPSAINDLCDNALLWGRLNGRRGVDEQVIERVLGGILSP
jgi:general secretion pathway protein A